MNKINGNVNKRVNITLSSKYRTHRTCKQALFIPALLFGFICLGVPGSSLAQQQRKFQTSVQNPAAYVNPMIGASTSVGDAGIYHGLGKTFPGATTPYGMVQVSPNTITGGDNGSGYSDEHTSIEGFAFTQMSGIGWYGDLGNFLVMPTTGNMQTFSGTLANPALGYRSLYNKHSEAASAGYYSVFLEKYKVKAEMTAAAHSGMLRFTYGANKKSRIQIDLARRVGGTSTKQYVRIVDDHTIEGWMRCTPEGGGWGDGDGKANYTVYFYTQFSKPLKEYGVWSVDIADTANRKREAVTSAARQKLVAGARTLTRPKEFTGKHIGFYTEFATKDQEAVLMKTGISFVSMAGAKSNLAAEIKDWNFDGLHQKAVALWNKALGKIQIQGGTEEEKTVFYTALYHTMIDPRDVTDVNGLYTGGDGKAHQAKDFTKRTIFSGWDVFRSQMPLQTIINPRLVSDMINSLITLADQTGNDYFPRWELLNAYTGCMIGNPAVSMVADAYMKGIRSYDVQKAYKYSLGTVKANGNGSLGYTPGGQCISETLERGYSDWCLSVMAGALGKPEVAKSYLQKSMAYKNIFDPEKGWFRPKNQDGSWLSWPKNGRLTQNYGTIESNPYQQGWFVPQDVQGMVALMGGTEKVKNDLESMFEHTPDNFMWNDYYNHANEPVHHVPFLFNRLGAPWLTQKWTRKICAEAYHNKVEGLVGNEDVGQMSAWYVLAAAGIHPICPGEPRYAITSPVFSKISFKLMAPYATGKRFTIIAKGNSRENIYIQSASLNGRPYNKSYLLHKDIAAGGTLELVMGSTPNKGWGLE